MSSASSSTANYVAYCEELASGLEPEEWRTESVLQFDNVIAGYAADSQEAKARAILFRAHYDGLLQAYLSTSIETEEIAAESVAGHLVLTTGLRGWVEAIDLVIKANQDDVWVLEQAGQKAEQANRLLVALQLFQQEIAGHLDSRKHESTSALLGNWEV